MQFTLSIVQGDRHHAWSMADGTNHVGAGVVVADTTFAVTGDADGAQITVHAERAWQADVVLSAEVHAASGDRALWPMYQGILERRDADPTVRYEFRGPGWCGPEHEERRLAIPAVILESGEGYRVVGVDPGFSAHLTVAAAGDRLAVTVEWTYRHEAGRHDGISRRIVTAAAETLDEALTRWFQQATPDVPVGPAWLHDIAWTNYDFMSKNGRGWYDDIDAFCELVGDENHHRAAFTMHAWYDTVGRYCYDPDSKELDEAWTVFPYIGDARLLARQGVADPSGTHPTAYTFRNLGNYHPLEMDWQQVRERISYAKKRGLRVPFYLVTGMMAVGGQAAHAAAGDGLDAEANLWIGPEAVGETYLMNPLHPDVRSRLLGLTQAVLDKVGDLIDALVIDEAYYIGYGQLGPASCPGYADLGQATLLQEMAQLCHAHRSDIALLTADHLGTQFLEHKAYPYSLFADGIYHDAWCHAQTWDACRIPAWRNVTWSCNWAPSSAILNTKWAVLAHDAPIATGNGCFGDDIGLAEMNENDRALLRHLWSVRIGRTRNPRLTVVDTQ
jgi:hypothetical protein